MQVPERQQPTAQGINAAAALRGCFAIMPAWELSAADARARLGAPAERPVDAWRGGAAAWALRGSGTAKYEVSIAERQALLNPDCNLASRAYAKQLRAVGANGASYPSIRERGGHAAGCFGRRRSGFSASSGSCSIAATALGATAAALPPAPPGSSDDDGSG